MGLESFWVFDETQAAGLFIFGVSEIIGIFEKFEPVQRRRFRVLLK